MIKLHRVKHIPPTTAASLNEILHLMAETGVLGAGRLGRAFLILIEMFKDPKCLTYLALSGPMVPGGLREIISYLLHAGYIDVLVTSGANIVHDLIEAYGGGHYQVPTNKTDAELREAGMGRIANVFAPEKDFEMFESKIYEFLDSLPLEKKTTLSPSEFLNALGETLSDRKSIVRQAYLNNVPIFSPGLMDSMLGFHLFTYSTTTTFKLDFVKDLRLLAEIVGDAKKTGAIMLGGGLTKHFTMGSTILRGGLDLAVQITLDRPEGGSLSGAPLSEGVSWQKIQEHSKFETVIGDATIIFPFLILGVLKELSIDKTKHFDMP